MIVIKLSERRLKGYDLLSVPGASGVITTNTTLGFAQGVHFTLMTQNGPNPLYVQIKDTTGNLRIK